MATTSGDEFFLGGFLGADAPPLSKEVEDAVPAHVLITPPPRCAEDDEEDEPVADDSDGEVRIGIVCMTKQPTAFSTWLAYHRERCGIERFYLHFMPQVDRQRDRHGQLRLNYVIERRDGSHF